jgi:glycosyltransferase involved in cell wall biosynthesis
LFRGSGTRLKVLTYLAAGKAVVATRKACEGLDVRDGVHALLRDDPVEFAGAIRDLLADSGRRRELGAAGRTLVESRYDWRAYVRSLEDLSHSVLSGEPVRGG